MSRKIVKVKKIFLRNHQNEFIREFFRFGLKLNPIILIMSHRRRLVIFPDYFNFKVEVTSDGWAYWADSMRVPPIVPGVNEELSILLTFRLEQNYPNPFNPTTKIKYSIPDMSKVSLAMNNLLGEEVIILVNEEQTAGNYIVEFNASSLPSGVYFYRIQAGEFVQTKKVVLIK